MDSAARFSFTEALLRFLHRSPTPFHAAAAAAEDLEKNGFCRLDESAAWRLASGGKYYVRRDAGALAAFTLGTRPPEESGFRMIGAHTDSPCLKIRPAPDMNRHGTAQLGVEVYGGALLNPWFDRDLSIAGLVVIRTAAGEIRSLLLNFDRPLAVVPSLAIHLDREANQKRSINAQTDLLPVIATIMDGNSGAGSETGPAGRSGKDPDTLESLVRRQLGEKYPDLEMAELLAHDLRLHDTAPARRIGLHRDFITGGRLDNLVSCFVAVAALKRAAGKPPAMIILNDHEEVGSATISGAQGSFLSDLLARILPSSEDRLRAIRRSFFWSVDAAHGLHPNFAAKSEDGHAPLLNCGPVLKLNAARRYATEAEGAALFHRLCRSAGVPFQTFLMRNDMSCGSTIGPLTATRIGIRTLDIGVAMWGMHSIRETIGAEDPASLYETLAAFLREEEI
ncbi:MAG: M18 family aminopeptidase [Desulfobacterales bacterium]|nr:MAG: M18 family aminopeptidase [Desulfobacterales bacterium]